MKTFKKLLGNRVLLKQKKVRKVGTILLASGAVEKTQDAVVFLAGPECTDVKKDDLVLFDKFAGQVIEETDDYTLTLLAEDDIYAIMEE